MDALAAAVEAGADVVVLCDTNGGSLPHEIHAITATGRDCASPCRVGIHTHNDAGLAVANTLEAVRAGAAQVQGTINGYGERCGNADLCTIIPNLMLKMGRTCLRPRSARAAARAVAVRRRPGEPAARHARRPYVGQSAFSHKGGPHVNAVAKNPRTFEHIDPDSVGNERRILVSELSGGSNVLLKAIELGAGRHRSLRRPPARYSTSLKEMESKGYAFEAADASFQHPDPEGPQANTSRSSTSKGSASSSRSAARMSPACRRRPSRCGSTTRSSRPWLRGTVR